MQWTRPKKCSADWRDSGAGTNLYGRLCHSFCKTSGRAESWDGKGSSAFGHEPDM